MRRQIVLACGLLTGLLLLTLAGLASAHSFRAATNVSASPDETINHTLFAAGSTVDIGSEVNGDVFCVGQTINITGTVHGDVMCAGQTVTVSGTVDGDVRLAGQTVTLGAKVAGNATVAGQTFVLTSGGAVGRDLTAGSADVTLDGTVGRDVAFGATTAVLNGEVGRDVVGSVQNLSLNNKAYVHGKLSYTSANQLHKSTSARVQGTISHKLPAKHHEKHGAVFGFNLLWFGYWLLALVLLTLVTTLAFPRVLHKASQAGLPWPWKPLLVGLVASFIVPVCFIVAAVTVIGLPVALIILLVWLLIELLGFAFASYYVGRILLQHSTRPLWIALAGALVLGILLFIPFIGIAVLVLATWIGEGLVLLTIRSHLHKPVYSVSAPVTQQAAM